MQHGLSSLQGAPSLVISEQQRELDKTTKQQEELNKAFASLDTYGVRVDPQEVRDIIG